MSLRKTNFIIFCHVQDLDLNTYDMKLNEIVYERERKQMGWGQRKKGIKDANNTIFSFAESNTKYVCIHIVMCKNSMTWKMMDKHLWGQGSLAGSKCNEVCLWKLSRLSHYFVCYINNTNKIKECLWINDKFKNSLNRLLSHELSTHPKLC